MNRLTFRPHVEALAPRVLPDANPLTASVVGPFAPGMYPQNQPPAFGHEHEWREDALEHADGIMARAAARGEEADGQFLQLRDGGQPLRDALRERMLDLAGWASGAQARAERAAADALTRYNRDLAAGRFAAAHKANLEYHYQRAAAQQYGNVYARAAALWVAPDAQLVNAVNSANGQAQTDFGNAFAGALAAQTRAEQGRGSLMQFYHAVGVAYPLSEFYDRLSGAVAATARQFGQ
jgi:hypothetical protein